MANVNATTGIDTITQGSGDDTLTITDNAQVQGPDFFDGLGGTNTILCSTAAPGSLSLNSVNTDASHGLHNYGAISFVGAAFTAVFLDANQFGTGLISDTVAVTGTDGVGASLTIFNASI